MSEIISLQKHIYIPSFDENTDEYIDKYLDMTKALYKEVITVYKDARTEAVTVAGKVFLISDLKGVSLHSRDSPHNLLVFSNFSSEIKKTKQMSLILKKFEITHSLIILDKSSKVNIEKSIRNIPNIKVTDVNHFSAFDLVKFKKVVFTENSIKELEKRYS